jgi:hypothetical protein
LHSFIAFQIKGFSDEAKCIALIKENFRQAALATGAKTIIINTLLTRDWKRALFFSMRGKQDERELFALLEKAAEAFNAEQTDSETGIQVIVGNTPINNYRVSEENDMTAINHVREKVKDRLKSESNNSVNNHLVDELRKIYDNDLPLSPEHSKGAPQGDLENINMSLDARCKVMVSLLREIEAAEFPNQPPSIVMFDPCKSEKDRGGYVKLETMAYAAVMRVGGTITDYVSQFAYRIRAKTGGQGGSAGVNHIKDKEGISPKARPYQALKGETAKYNNKLPPVKTRSYQEYFCRTFFGTPHQDAAAFNKKNKPVSQS